MSESDPVIRRLQTGAAVWCAAATLLALVGWPGRFDVAAGIVGGALLALVSFIAIKSSIDAALALVGRSGDEPIERRRLASRALVRLVGRYGLLAVLAYVMIARLRLHPVGLVVGASSLVVAATVEAARWLARPTPRASR